MPRAYPHVSYGNSGLPQYQNQQDSETADLYKKKGWTGGRKSRRKSGCKSKRKCNRKSCRRQCR